MPTTFPPIVCTLGTTTDDPQVILGMVAAGMGMARVNTAYGTIDQLAERMDLVRAVCRTPLMVDLKGRQLRVDCTTEKMDGATGKMVERPCRYPIAEGDLIFVGFQVGPVRFNHDFEDDLQVGDRITFENGTIQTRVADAESEAIEPLDSAVLLEVLDAGSGQMTPQMGANVPGRHLHLPSLTDRDRAVLELGVERRAEAYALSFVQQPEDLLLVHHELVARGDDEAMLIAKIENQQGIDRLGAIVRATRDLGRPLAVMIARGDLFVELPIVDLPAVQNKLVGLCKSLDVPSIVATGLLLSMQNSPRPSRSEVCDVAAAARSGANSFMLSDETSNGVNPVLAIRTLSQLVHAYRPQRPV
ncbi:MAG: hypothetical protein HN348_08785 [Proteobacteria bacterium]|jgi:pyruvate kinase|nr:hypothetical protein [Pseudomonadota bacterium]